MKTYIKQISIVALSLVFLNTTIKAQQTDEARFGFKGGVNFTNLNGGDNEKAEQSIGYNVGVFGKFPIGEVFSIQPELYYTTKGSTVTYKNLIQTGRAKYKFNYIELPLIFVANIAENINVHLGPYASYLISSKFNNETPESLFTFNENDYNKLDAGAAAGVGIDIGNLGIGARYYYGFLQVGKDGDIQNTSNRAPNSRNSVFNVYVAFSLL
jgi:Outer membrane protein beta-barrel domain